MIYLLVKTWQEWLDAHGIGFLRVFTFVTFQATVSIVVSFLISVLFGSKVIAWLQRHNFGDQSKFDEAEIGRIMEDKRGTPTMGGLLIIAAIGVTTLLLADLRNFYVQMGLVALVGLGAIGASDDWLKLTAGRRSASRQGLSSAEKMLCLVGLALMLSFFTYRHGREVPAAHEIHLPFFKNLVIPLGMTAFMLISTLVMTGASNAVNLTDGLDGLAAGCMAIVSFAFVILSMIAGTLDWASYLYLPYIPTSAQMAVLSGAIVGASLGFLWFNCKPAKVFMGDTGSLALGGLIGYIAIVTRHELTLFLVGGIFVVEALSVMLQVGWFKYTKHRTGVGERIFLIAPLHHHFQKKGWTETQVVVRFWLIGAMLAAMAIATVKLR